MNVFAYLITLLILSPYISKQIRRRREERRQEQIYRKVTIPQQLVDIVRQAHTGDSFRTDFYVRITAEDRQKLMYPLTQGQVETIRETSMFACQEKQFFYRLKEYKFTDDELSGTVLATIRFRDDSKGINLDYRDVPIFLRLRGWPGRGWYIDAVEYL